MNAASDKVLIFGSCVSRDILAYPSKFQSNFELVDYYSRCSLASLSAIPFTKPLSVNVDNIKSSFQKKMVERDMLKTFFDDIKKHQFDILLIDLIDERFNLWIGAESQVCTISAELGQSGFVADHPGRVEVSGSEQFWKRWEAGWENFIYRISSIGALHRLIINKVFWSKCIENGSCFQGGYSSKRIMDANDLLVRMYRRIENDIPNSQIIDFPEHCLLAAAEHKWGISPFHYVERYYELAHRKIVNILLIQKMNKKTPKTKNKKIIGKIRTFDPLTEILSTNGDSFPMALMATDKSESHNAVMSLADYSVWRTRLYDIENLENFIANAEFKDGIYRIRCGSVTLDILIQGLHGIRSIQHHVCLVGLGGALSNRVGTRPPYFSGRGVAGELKLPLICISDPSFALSEMLPLGWYAGHSEKPDLAQMIARILDRISACYGLRLILFGGSGGGFAALAQSCLLTCESTAIVWNPQTSIEEYVPGVVLQYLKVAFPALSEEVDVILALPVSNQKQHLPKLLQRAGIFHSLVNVPRSNSARILYLQNKNDWHVNAHAKPYLGQEGWHRLGGTSFAQGQSLALHMGNWGVGHAAPPVALLTRLIADVANGLSVIDIATGLSDSAAHDDHYQWFSIDLPAMDWKPFFQCSIANGLLRITVETPLLTSAKGLEYAVYLIKNREKKKVFWYQESPVFEAAVDGLEIDAIQVFVRDAFRDVRTASLPWTFS